MSTVQFAPFNSFVETSFFHELSSRKLNQLKLNEEKLPIYGLYNTPIPTSRSPSLRVTGQGFKPTNESIQSYPVTYYSPGSIAVVNTIDTFKQTDKQALLKQESEVILQSIQDLSVLRDPSLLTYFHLLVYSDIKAYKFYYWFAFPSISIEWSVVNNDINPQSQLSTSETTELCKSIESWRQALQSEPRQWGFFLLRKHLLGSQDHSWEVGKLNEYETFWTGENISPDKYVGFADPSTIASVPGWPFKNLLVLLNRMGLNDVSILCLRDFANVQTSPRSFWVDVKITGASPGRITGWERNSSNKLAPKLSDLGSLMDPLKLADQAVDLNLKLMKWRIAPSLDLDIIKNSSCLMLGAGTLGSYISRGLLGWGVRKITFVDSGRVSFSNPVRQPLYSYKDCLNGGAPKALRAAEALKEIFPMVESEGYEMEIPMAGHPITNETRQKVDYDRLVELISQHDTIFLLMDSRESRWLPTVIASSMSKLVINVALGFDSYVVMRHGVRQEDGSGTPNLGCYYCNDVVAPIDSLSGRTLDQMCTVTRPGIAMLAAANAVELWASIKQHPLRGRAPAPNKDDDASQFDSPLSEVPHQIRGFLQNFNTMKIQGPSYSCCSACSDAIITEWRVNKWQFVMRALNEPGLVETISGLAEVQRRADELDIEGSWDEEDDDLNDDSVNEL